MMEKRYSACTMCGVIVEYYNMDSYHQYQCPRCKTVIYRPGQPFHYIIGMAVAALFFFITSNFLNFLSLKIAGDTMRVSVVEAIFRLSLDGHYFVTAMVIVTGIVMPIVLLTIMLMLLIPISLNIRPSYFTFLYRRYSHIRHWAMADVYVLAVIVALIKLTRIGEVHLGMGLLMFVLFLISFYAAYTWFNPHDIWHRYEMED